MRLSFLIGCSLDQVAVGPGDVQLRFSGGAHVQCECTVIDSAGAHHPVGVPAGRALLDLIGLNVVAVDEVDDGRSLGLSFDDGRTVTLVEEADFDYLCVSDPRGTRAY